MSIVYSCVAYKTTILAHSSKNPQLKNQFAADLPQILSSIDTSKNTRAAQNRQNMDFFCYVNEGVTYVCLSEAGLNKTVAFSFLNDVSSSFSMRYGTSSVKFATPYQMDTDFAPQLSNMMQYAVMNASKTRDLKDNVQEVKGLVLDNIDKVMQRAQKLNSIADRSDELKDSAVQFSSASRKLKHDMLKKKIIIIASIVAAVIVILIIIIVPSVISSQKK